MAQHNELGKQGEDLAVKHLKKLGYSIVERNWRFGKDEIDIIARIGDELVIVEVKTRNSNFFGDPQAFISKSKQGRLIKAANQYVVDQDLDLEVRMDAIGVVINSNEQSIQHIEDAFQPSW